MNEVNLQKDILERLSEVRKLRPELRFGQIVATAGLLGEDETGHTLWDLEDTEFASALNRFAEDLNRSGSIAAKT